MTKKRFTWDNLGEVDAIADGDTFRWYLMLDGITDLVKFMNEQDQRITELEAIIRQCKIELTYDAHRSLQKRLEEILL